NDQAPNPKLQTPEKRQTPGSKYAMGRNWVFGIYDVGLLWSLELGIWSFLTVSDHADLQKKLGYVFRDPVLLRLALTHPSVAHEKGAPVQTNQRLEFLGDAVLQLVLTRVLYEKFPSVGEGPLTKARAKMVNRRTLAEHGRRLGLDRKSVV